MTKVSESQTTTAVAFKEWAVIAGLLGAGEQILILRKGGIHEKRGGFEVEHRGFYLFPTLFHQQRESVVPAVRTRCDEFLSKYSDPGSVSIEHWIEVAESRWVTEWPRIGKLAPFHAWTDAIIRDRFGWGKDEGIFVIAARVFRLAAPRVVPVLKEYGGCKSWIDVEASAFPPLEGKRPVLGDAQFANQLREVLNCLS